ncbi:MAG: DUF5694 domain-containing protein [Saprospiraceae bacterium]
MKKIVLPFIACLIFILTENPVQAQAFDPDSILIGSDARPQVLLLGTFHFAYYNLDAHKVEADDQIDILSEKKQEELAELLDYVARFKPTKIVVEAGRNTGYLMRHYERWQAGEEPLERDEIDQIGLRLLDRLGLDTIYGADANGIYQDLYHHPDSLVFRTYLDAVFDGYDYNNEEKYGKRYQQYYQIHTELTTQLSLLEYFKFLNATKVQERGYGAYLVGDFTLGESQGADALALYWYSRNLRIFRNIQRLSEGPEDRILVLFGAGHTAAMQHMFASSPEFELISFESLDK